jgi:hypothetical protein
MARWLFAAVVALNVGCSSTGDDPPGKAHGSGGLVSTAGAAGTQAGETVAGMAGAILPDPAQSVGGSTGGARASTGGTPSFGGIRTYTGGTSSGGNASGGTVDSGGAGAPSCPDPCTTRVDIGAATGPVCYMLCRPPPDSSGAITTWYGAVYSCGEAYRQTTEVQRAAGVAC